MSNDEVQHVSKTPFYSGIHAARYQRQEAITSVEESTKRHLICYVSGETTSLDRNDTIGFVDMLHNVPDGENLDLVLHTPGGDIDEADKLMRMIRAKVGEAELRVIVPDYAKSAGTLMALGAAVIVMSDSSELGPIDPQIELLDDRGNLIQHRVQGYLDAYKTHTEVLAGDPDNVASQIMLNKLDPSIVPLFEGYCQHARDVAESLLREGMFRTKGNWSGTASDLLNTKIWKSHAQVISWREASTQLNLTVEYLHPNDSVWNQFWRLYCLQRLAIEPNQKLYESKVVSIIVDDGRS